MIPALLLIIFAGVTFAWVGVAFAEAGDRDDRTVSLDPSSAPGRGGALPPQAVDLDRLLRLPDAYGGHSERRGGATEDVWRSRFASARKDLADAEEALSSAKKELRATASESGSWNVTAPGGGNEVSPLSYKLRQEIRRQTEARKRHSRGLRNLEIEANLSAVPEDWRN